MIGGGGSFVERRPEPAALWVRYRPRRWPGDGLPWTDAASGEVGFGDADTAIDWSTVPDDDVVYLPPLSRSAETGLLRWAAAARTPPLVQRRPGDAPLGAGREVWDPLVAILRREQDWLEELPPGADLLWPLLPGGEEDPDAVFPGERLRSLGVETVHLVALRLSPEACRRLVEELDLPEESWSALFHGRSAEPRRWARVVDGWGFRLAHPRPLPRSGSAGSRVRGNRRLAEALAWAGELSSRLALGEGTAQGYFRAARHVDECPWALGDLEREGNLQILPWLEGAALELVRARLRGDDGALADLWRRYLAREEERDDAG